MKFTKGINALLLAIILLLSFGVYNYMSHTYVKVEFEKTDPMPAKMGVYFKGYKLGQTTKLKISKDFRKTYLYITFNQRGLHLPNNIRAEVKKYDDETKFVDLIWPIAPSIKYIKSGDVIKGKYNLLGADGISNTNQAHLDILAEKGERLLNSAIETTDTLTELISILYNILAENRTNILSSTYSLKNSMTNLEITTKNLSECSKDFTNISKNFNKTGSDFLALSPKLNELIEIGENTLCRLNYILAGLGETLHKRAGGMRVLFGVPIKE